MKFKYIVLYENNSDKYDIEYYPIKVKVTARVKTIFPFTAIEAVMSTSVQARKLLLCMYVHLI